MSTTPRPAWAQMTNTAAFDAARLTGKARKVAESAADSLFPDLIPEPARKPARQPVPDPCGTLSLFDLAEL